MNIGIFGCSFADETLHDETYPGHKSWSAHLRDLGYNITNFALKGSSVWYSYNLYQQYHKDFDLILFLETTAGRYYAENIKTHLLPSSKVSGYTIDITNFYKFIFNRRYDEAMNELMVERIKRNTNVIHCVAMDTIGKASRLENAAFNFRPELHSEIDNRFCHLSDLNNRLLAEYIHNCITNKETIRFDSVWYQTPSIEDRHKYFIPK